jgi:hypothetical protein
MERIPREISTTPTFEEKTLLEASEKKRIAKGVLNYAGIAVGVFLMFAVVVIVTTDIHLITPEEIAALGLDFFLLMFCSYSMYVNCADSGMRAGLLTNTYLEAIKKFEELKNTIIARKWQGRLLDFCLHYVKQELKGARLYILASVGIGYEEYESKYITLGKDAVKKTSLTKRQKEAINKANEIEPIHLTPEMILKRGRGSSRRSPLGVKPETKKVINFSGKFVTTFIVSFLLSIIVLDIIQEPTWVIVASCAMKLLAVVMNGFMGYKFGFENIVIDTANYISDQSDLMTDAMQWLEANPEKKPGPEEIPETNNIT